MRLAILLSVLFISGSVFAQTYRSGGTRKANFGAQQTQDADQNGESKSSVPGAKSNVQTRTFTSYGARRQWGKCVQTQTVQTTTAGTAAPENTGEVQLPGAEKKLGAAAKKSIPAPKGAAAPAQQPAAAQAGTAAQPPAMPAEAAAAMQQVQGLQEMLKGLGGAAGAAGGASAPAAGAAGMPAGMNIPGMPDMSALMGAAAAGQQPTKK